METEIRSNVFGESQANPTKPIIVYSDQPEQLTRVDEEVEDPRGVKPPTVWDRMAEEFIAWRAGATRDDPLAKVLASLR